ncbi:MAG: phenylalanine--tRNA ligase beta subunit-related protein [Solirubrobacteraceae bacterium]
MISDEPVEGAVEAALAEELPGLRLWWLPVAAGEQPSPPALRERLRDLSSRFRGAQAVALRSKPIPHAYRAFFRHIGLDPDVDRVPVEAAVVQRLTDGQFRSRSRLRDALTIAVMETDVPVWALDADAVGGELGLRRAVEHEPLGRGDDRAPWLPAGRLVVADRAGPVAVLFGAVAASHHPTAATRRSVLFSVQVEGVPAIHVSEALWTVVDILDDAEAP